MKIFIDLRTATDHFPGIGRYGSNLVEAMQSQLGEWGRLYILVNSQCSSLKDTSSSGNYGSETIRIPAAPFSLSQQWVVPRVLNRENADLYHSLYYIMPYCSRVPTVLTVYDLIPSLFPDYFSFKTRLLYRLCSYWAVKKSRHIIAISRSTKNDLATRYRISPEKITVIHLAADHSFYPRGKSEIERTLQVLGLPPRYILYVGSNKPHKNLKRLLKAWEKLSSAKPALVIAGLWDPRFQEIRRYVESKRLQNSVYFAGQVDDKLLPALYSGAATFVFATEYEGFGLPLLEAMACGTPVITSNVSSMPEIAGDAALLVNPLNIDELSSALRVVLEDEEFRSKYQALGVKRASYFSWEKCASQTIDVYKKIIGNAHPSGL